MLILFHTSLWQAPEDLEEEDLEEFDNSSDDEDEDSDEEDKGIPPAHVTLGALNPPLVTLTVQCKCVKVTHDLSLNLECLCCSRNYTWSFICRCSGFIKMNARTNIE